MKKNILALFSIMSLISFSGISGMVQQDELKLLMVTSPEELRVGGLYDAANGNNPYKYLGQYGESYGFSIVANDGSSNNEIVALRPIKVASTHSKIPSKHKGWKLAPENETKLTVDPQYPPDTI